MMPPTVQVSKATELKALQRRANKAKERHQHHTTQLDEFQDIDEKLEVKALNKLQYMRESHKQLTKKSTEHPTKKDAKECVEFNMEKKELIDEVKQ